MLVNQNRVLLVVIAVTVGCLVNMPELGLKDPMMKAGVFSVCLYVAYAFLNSQGLVEGESTDQDGDQSLCEGQHYTCFNCLYTWLYEPPVDPASMSTQKQDYEQTIDILSMDDVSPIRAYVKELEKEVQQAPGLCAKKVLYGMNKCHERSHGDVGPPQCPAAHLWLN